MTRPVVVVLALLALAPAPVASVSAQTIEAARALYAEGRFLEAARDAKLLKTSEGYALAASSLAVHGFFKAENERKQALFKEAIALAEEAARLDPGNPQAHIELAHAKGRYAETIGTLEAIEEGFAEQVRKAAEKALALEPELAAAHLVLGTWHARVIGEGGFMARMLYGASEKDALAHYEKALELAPDRKYPLVQYALGLLLLDDDDHRPKIRRLFTRAIALPPADALDRLVHKQAVEGLAAVDGG